MQMDSRGGQIKARARWLGIAGLAAMVALIALPISAALAAPPSPAAPAVRDQHERLERILQREQRVLAGDEKRLDRTATTTTQAQRVIDNQKARGKDTSALESALAAFKTAVNTATAEHEKAEGILNTHAGFDANGEVTDATQARETLKTAGQAERAFQQAMRKATSGLRKAIREYRQANRPAPTATPTQG